MAIFQTNQIYCWYGSHALPITQPISKYQSTEGNPLNLHSFTNRVLKEEPMLHLCQISNTHTHNRFTALWNLSGTTRMSRYQKKHSPTHTHCGHQSSQSTFSIYYDPWHPPHSIHMLYSLFPQSLSKFSLVYLLA